MISASFKGLFYGYSLIYTCNMVMSDHVAGALMSALMSTEILILITLTLVRLIVTAVIITVNKVDASQRHSFLEV